MRFFLITFDSKVNNWKCIFQCSYFREGLENESSDEASDMYRFWHAKLADFFENCSNIDRKTEVSPLFKKAVSFVKYAAKIIKVCEGP